MTETFCSTNLTFLRSKVVNETTFLITVPSAKVNVLLPVYPVPSLATAYTYAVLVSGCFGFGTPATFSAYLISKSSAVALVVPYLTFPLASVSTDSRSVNL